MTAGIGQTGFNNLQVGLGLAVVQLQQQSPFLDPLAGRQVMADHPAADLGGEFHRFQRPQIAHGLHFVTHCVPLRRHDVHHTGRLRKTLANLRTCVQVAPHEYTGYCNYDQSDGDQPLFPHRNDYLFYTRYSYHQLTGNAPGSGYPDGWHKPLPWHLVEWKIAILLTAR